MSRGLGDIQKKVLLLLAGGLVLGLTTSPRRYFRILKEIGREWENIERRALKRAIACLYQSKLVAEKLNKDGSVSITISEKGQEKILTYKLEDLKISKPHKWDKKWRVVIFDIPENRKKYRDALRFHLKRLGFLELQKSVFVFPYECRDEIAFLVEFYQLNPHVRTMTVSEIDNQLHLEHKFQLRN